MTPHIPWERNFLRLLGALRQRRRARGLSQIDVAESLGCHRNTIIGLEGGRMERIDAMLLFRYAALVGIEVVCSDSSVSAAGAAQEAAS